MAQELNNDNAPIGKWKVEKQFSSERKVNLELNIKYSEKYKRYFGSILDYFGNPITLDSIKYNGNNGELTFSYHNSNREYYKLNIQDNLLKGEILGEETISVVGHKLGVYNPNVIFKYGPYKPTELTTNISDLFLETGNLKSKTVLLVVQGGPFLTIQYSNQFKKWEDELHTVFVKQAQHLNPSIFPPENNLTLSNAYSENLITVEILHKVINHFKSLDKKVIVWGTSYGAWVIQKYIAEYGVEADAVSVSAGRLDIEEKIYNEGKMHQIAYDITYKNDKPIYTKLSFTYPQPQAYLLASIDKERYTKTLKNKDLSKFVVYLYGKKDGTIGRLSENEVVFLKSKGVEIEMCNNCYHRQMVSTKKANSAIKKMLKFIR